MKSAARKVIYLYGIKPTKEAEETMTTEECKAYTKDKVAKLMDKDAVFLLNGFDENVSVILL